MHRQTCRHAQPTPTQPALFADRRRALRLLRADPAEPKPWHSLVEWIDSEGLAADLTDPAYDDPAHRQANFAHVQQIVEVFFLLQPASDIYHEGQQRGLPIGVLNAPDDLPHDEHLAARGFFVPVSDDAPGGPHLYPGAPIRFSAFAAPALARAPRLGEHTAEVLGGTG